MTQRVVRGSGSVWLALGGGLSLVAALLHVACIALGADWFCFFGAPEPAIVAYEQGDNTLVWMTLGITAILAIWAVFAFSGAGLIRRIPLLRTGLVAITVIYLLRGVLVFPALAMPQVPDRTFSIISSAVVLVYGIAYLVGTMRQWPRLGPADAVPGGA